MRFTAVGDISLGDHPLCVGFGAYSRFKSEQPIFPFRRVLERLQSSDLVFGNLECALSMRGLRPGDYRSIQMRGEPKHALGLAEAGFDVVNMANNHAMQHGQQAFLDTVDLLKSNGIACCGIRREHHRTATPAILRRNGLAIAFLGYSMRPRQYFEQPPLYAEGRVENIHEDIRGIRSDADVVVVSLHWGDEFIRRPSPEEIGQARGIIDAGADLILGHHPHVVRGIERYKKGWIVYSLGNFVCDMQWDPLLRASAIFSCTIGPSDIRDVDVKAVRINADYQPEVLPEPQASAFLAELDRLSNVLHDAGQPTGAYEEEADSALRAMRLRSQLFFLSRVWKYPPRALAMIPAIYLRNRWKELVGTSATIDS